MVNVGIIGMGMMGLTHLDAYAKRADARVIAIADADPNRRTGATLAKGNVKGQAQGGHDFSKFKQYAEGMDLINDPGIQVVDICLATPLHRQYAIAAMEAGKHVLVEKPLARTSADAYAIADAQKRTGVIAMPAMCIRFWPGWTWLKQAVVEKTYGGVLAATFRRVATHPGGAFYSNGQLSGGAALDLHIHDTDFVQYLFGIPKSVQSRGYSALSGAVDHLITQYHYDDVPLVSAEGSWVMRGAYPFAMQFTVNFDRATAVYDLLAPSPLMLYESGKDAVAVPLENEMGYDREIAYFIECVNANKQPTTVTLQQAADAVRIVEAEVTSVETRQAIPLTR